MCGERNRPGRSVFPGAFCVGVLLLFASAAALAQLPTATVLGVVKDGSGGVLPGATVTARHVATGQVRTTVAGGDGSYRLPALSVGSYEIRVELQGFRSEVRTGITLSVTQEAVVNFTLQLGSVAETVTVVGEAPLVNTTSAALGGLVDATRIESLPLLGRNYIDLTLMQTGVTEHQNYARGTARVGNWFSAKGATLRSNNYLLDGTMTNTLHGAGSASYSENTLGLDGIQEYRVLTSSFGAEYGMRMGSQTVMVSKSGTNDFHGSLFEFYRNDALKARDFFDQREEPKFLRHNVGGSFGGPIVKNKTFFFGVVEVVRERLGTTEISQTIPASARVNGGLVPQIAPIIKPFLDLYPLPNLPNDQYAFLYTQPTDEYYAQGKIDQHVSDKDTLFVRYTFNNSERTEVTGFPDFERFGHSRAHYTTLSWNRVISPTVVNTARASYSHTRIGLDPIVKFIGPQYSLMPGQLMGGVTPGPGITGLGGNNTELLYGLDTLAASNDVYQTRGRHSLKYGVLLNLMVDPYVTLRNATAGGITFASLPDFLRAGPVQFYNGGTPGSIFVRHYRYRTFGFYLQDDFKPASRVTLNLGLRYEFNTSPWELNGLNSNIKDIRTAPAPELGPTFENSSLRNWSPRLGFAWDVRGNGKTAIRGGSGLLYDIGWFNSNFVENTTGGPPFATQSRVNNAATFTLPLYFPPESVGRVLRTVDYHSKQSRLLEYNLTLDQELPWDIGLALAYAGSRGFDLPYSTEGNPRVPQILDGRYFWAANAPRINPNWDDVLWKTTGARSWYNSLQVSLIKRLSQGFQFQSSYTLAKQTADQAQAQLNGDIGGGGSVFSPNPFDSTYNLGPAQWDLRHNWKFNAIYHLPDVASPGLRRTLLNGWWVSTIMSLQTGYPFTLAINQQRSRSGVGAGGTNVDYPDLVPGVNPRDVTKGVSRGCLGVPAGTPVGTPDLWYDPCAFTIPQLGFLGNAGHNAFRGPGFASVNLALVKDSSLGGSRRLEFRMEVFNLFNRVNLGLPGRTVFSGRADVEAPLVTAGRITSTNSPARQLQLSSRLTF